MKKILKTSLVGAIVLGSSLNGVIALAQEDDAKVVVSENVSENNTVKVKVIYKLANGEVVKETDLDVAKNSKLEKTPDVDGYKFIDAFNGYELTDKDVTIERVVEKIEVKDEKSKVLEKGSVVSKESVDKLLNELDNGKSAVLHVDKGGVLLADVDVVDGVIKEEDFKNKTIDGYERINQESIILVASGEKTVAYYGYQKQGEVVSEQDLTNAINQLVMTEKAPENKPEVDKNVLDGFKEKHKDALSVKSEDLDVLKSAIKVEELKKEDVEKTLKAVNQMLLVANALDESLSLDENTQKELSKEIDMLKELYTSVYPGDVTKDSLTKTKESLTELKTKLEEKQKSLNIPTLNAEKEVTTGTTKQLPNTGLALGFGGLAISSLGMGIAGVMKLRKRK